MTRLMTALAALLAVGLAAGAGFWAARSRAGGVAVWSSGPTVTQLESLSQMVTTKVHVSDVLVASDAGYRGSWLVKGDGLIAVDLSRARVAESDPTARRARLVLPRPRVLSARVDHEQTMAWSVERTTWLPWRGDEGALRDEAMRHAQRLIDQAAGSDDNIAYAKAIAERVIAGAYRMVEWQVEIEWAKAP